MKHSKKVFARVNVIVTLKADNEKYLSNETSISWNLIGNVCLCYHDSEALNSLGIPKKKKKFIICEGGHARVKFPEMIVLKENAGLKLLVDDKGQLFATFAGNTVPIDKSYTIFLELTLKRRQEEHKPTSPITSWCTSYQVSKLRPR